MNTAQPTVWTGTGQIGKRTENDIGNGRDDHGAGGQHCDDTRLAISRQQSRLRGEQHHIYAHVWSHP